MKKQFMSILLILAVMLTTCFSMTSIAFADQGNVLNVQLTVDGGKTVGIKAYYPSYTYNTYVSLEDLAWALKGTEKNFDIQKIDGTWTVTTGVDYTGEEPVLFETPALVDPTEWHQISFDAYDITIDGKTYELRMYDNYRYSKFDGDVEGIYMRLIDLGMFLNIPVGHEGYALMSVDTEKDFVLDLEQLDEDAYFHDLDGVYLGDVTTGEKLYGWDENHQTEIASTSKLMTMTLVLDAIRAGEISMDTIYTISEAVYYESQSEDGTLHTDSPSSGKVGMKVGQTWSVEDLLHALMLPSANEAGTALAEAVAGSEAEFVKLMNAKADELGMTTAEFFNPHGLPNYTNSQLTGKRQNKMSAADMFTLCSYLLTEHYDETVAVTGDEIHYLTSLADDIYKDNGDGTYVLYGDEGGYIPYVKTTYETLHQNFGDEFIGLKTGSTNRSGSCIVVAETVEVAGETHVIVGVSFGGEDNRQRYESATVMLKYAQQWAAEMTEEITTAISLGGGILVDTTNENGDAGICFEIVNVKENDNVKVELYAGTTKLVTKELTFTEGGTKTCTFYTVGTSSSWEQTPSPWKAYDNVVPTHAVLYINGTECGQDAVDFTETEWIAFPGTAYVSSYVPSVPSVTPSTPTVPSDSEEPAVEEGAVLKATVDEMKLVTRSEMSSAKGGKAIKVYWYEKDGEDLRILDGFEVFRSTKRFKGYSNKPIFETEREAYWNTAIEEGVKYYYKVRGYVEIDGEKYYTDWSSKAWRTVG